MKHSVTIDDILHSIEFELAQSAVSRTDLGAGLDAVRQFQNKARAETLQSGRALGDTRALVNQQYQIHDMHLTLLQEMAATVQALQLDVRRLGQLPLRSPTAANGKPGATSAQAASVSPATPPLLLDASAEDGLAWPTEAIDNAMRPDALKIKRNVRLSTTPILGALIRRVRTALHDLTLFYLNQLAQKQTVINQVYGDRLLQLSQLISEQQEQIDALHAQVAALTGQPPDA